MASRKKNPPPPPGPSKALELRQHYYYRVLAAKLVKPIAKTSLTPNMLTLTMVGLTPVIFVLLLSNSLWINILGILFSRFAKVLDYLDGTLAREKNLMSPLGQYLDSMFHSLHPIAVFLPLGLRMYYAGHFGLLLASFAIILAILFSQQNYSSRSLYLKTAYETVKISRDSRSRRKVLLFAYSIPNVYLMPILFVVLLLQWIPYFLIFYCAYAVFDSLAKAYLFSRI
jgi:phosphatidylglycerophosphate synthase